MATKLKEYFPMIREREHSQRRDAEDRLPAFGAEERLLFGGSAASPV